MDITNFKQLEDYLNKKVRDVLQQQESNVKNVVVHELIESIEENVYNAYLSPANNPYERRMDQGGLTDRENFAVEPTSDGVAISSSRKGYDRSGTRVDVMEIIEGYKEYSIPDTYGYGYEEPRNAVEPAREKLRNSRGLKNALKLDLINEGFKVE